LRGQFKELSFHQTVRKHQNLFFQQLLESLRPGEALMTLDYSKWYASDNERIYDLILVVSTRPNPCGPIVELIINNFFVGHHTWMPTAAILTELIKKGIFERLGVKLIHKVSDTGTGFRQTETFHWDTVMSQLTGIEFRSELKAEYHGYSASDQHASVLSRIFDDLRTSSKLVGAEQFAAAVRRYREGAHPQTLAFAYESDLGDKDELIQAIATSTAHRKPQVLIRQFHSFRPFRDNGKLVPGVVTAARLSGEKHTAVLDMRPGVATCDVCSCAKMRPVAAHGRGKKCPSATSELPAIDLTFDDDAAPLSVLTSTTMLPLRFGASLVNRYAKKKPAKRKGSQSKEPASKRLKKDEEEAEEDSTSEDEGMVEPPTVPLEIMDEIWEPLPSAAGQYKANTFSQRRYLIKFQQGTELSTEWVLAEDTNPTPDIRRDIIEQHLLADDPLNHFYDTVKAPWRKIHPNPPAQPPNPKRPKRKCA
jgi:hypothetical protein